MQLSLQQLRDSKRAIEQSGVLRECPPAFLAAFLAGLPQLCAEAVAAGKGGELQIGALLTKILQQHAGGFEVCVAALAVLVGPGADELYDGVVCSSAFAQQCFAAQQRWAHCDALAFAAALVVARASRCRALTEAACGGERVRGMMAIMRGSGLREVQEVCVTFFVDACLREPALSGSIARAGGARRGLALLRQPTLSHSGALLCLSFMRMLLVFADPLQHGTAPPKLYASLSAELSRLLGARAVPDDLCESVALTMVVLADVVRAASPAAALDHGRCADVLARALSAHPGMHAATAGVVVPCLHRVCADGAPPPGLAARAAAIVALSDGLDGAGVATCVGWLARMPEGVAALARGGSCAQLVRCLRACRGASTGHLSFLSAVFAARRGCGAPCPAQGGLLLMQDELQCASPGAAGAAGAACYVKIALVVAGAVLPLGAARARDHAVAMLLCARSFVPDGSPLDLQLVALLVALL